MRVLQPIGVELALQIDRVGAAAVEQVRNVLAEHGVAIVRDCPLDDHRFLGFLSHFGNPVFTEGETPVAGFEDLNVVSNVGRSAPPRSVFHVDTSYVSRPPAYTALRTVAVPARGGQTWFTNQYRAFDTLPADVRERLRGRSIRHTSGRPGLGEHEPAAEHPALRVHPLSGRTSLYVSTPERCVSVSGLDERESRRLIAYLYEHSTREDNVLRHSWRAGDLVMWDNGVVLHKADHSDVQGDRVLHRGMVDGYAADAG